jgi:hypothetical protein
LDTANRSLPLLPRLHAWLSPMDAPRSADLIFVLTGNVNRKEHALKLFHEGRPIGIVQTRDLLGLAEDWVGAAFARDMLQESALS